ncbi:aldo/keto reductase [Polluticaenibacter yanchengensis]|uniref:Aldo/keto reductase n=1 Tax=Polluticaenibacter yanchengensis TaxID=3014562 RepID=A0ABT4UIV5_9BACT|nr:aldo/keto reductase [Chitinophagaceae bacterium LY-5]
MNKRIIKNTDLEIAPINLGGNVFGWTLDEQQSFNILDKFAGAGFNFIDTADMYSFWIENGKGGESETIIGKWFKERNNRQDIILATKVGGATNQHGLDVSRKHILKSVDESLQRLGTDYIDLYYTHYDDNITPVEETLQAYDDIIKAGKVRFIAASNVSPARLEESFEISEAKGLHKYVALQPHYNLLERAHFENDYAPLVEQYDLSVFPYWSLASGFLTGKYRTESDFSKSPRGNDAGKYLNEKGLNVLSALDKVAEKHRTQQSTVALAWLLANPLVTAPIVSATSDRQLQTIIDAPTLVLDADDIALLNEAGK